MSLANPIWLMLLLLIPALLMLASGARRRGDRYAVRFPAAGSLAQAAAASRSPFDKLPVALLLAALAVLAIAIAGPQRTVREPIEGATVMLVTDHSGSMAAKDVDPTRLDATTQAALAFLDSTPKRTQVGLVTYSDGPDQAVQPSLDREAVRQGLEAQAADGATATGSALQVALDMLRRRAEGRSRKPPAAIVLLSDGRTTTGSDPLGVAREAKELGIPISTVSLGTDGATIPNPLDPTSSIPVPPDPATLREIASITGGRAFTTADSDQLNSIYESLGSTLATRQRKKDLTLPFVGGALVLLLAAGVSSVAQRGRVPA